MSKLVQLLKGAAKSNTIQFNAIFLAVLTALLQTDFIQSNPDYLAIMAGINAVVNILFRGKTDKPLSQR